MESYGGIYETPVGRIGISDNGQAVTGLFFPQEKETALSESALTRRALQELMEYLSGRRRCFSVPLLPSGTPFQLSVWNALLEIPYGETRSYRDIARRIGNERACRAVGSANHHNPISIFIPCHRVVGANGSLTGYGGGLPMKEKLLMLERETLLKDAEAAGL